jgi:hypothetical protein
MPPIRAFALLVACSLCVSCAGVTREHALATAKREVERRHCPLPAHYRIDVGEAVYQAEFERERPLWGVHFYVITSRGRRDLVTVFIDRRSGAVDMFSDRRQTVPSRI